MRQNAGVAPSAEVPHQPLLGHRTNPHGFVWGFLGHRLGIRRWDAGHSWGMCVLGGTQFSDRCLRNTSCDCATGCLHRRHGRVAGAIRCCAVKRWLHHDIRAIALRPFSAGRKRQRNRDANVGRYIYTIDRSHLCWALAIPEPSRQLGILAQAGEPICCSGALRPLVRATHRTPKDALHEGSTGEKNTQSIQRATSAKSRSDTKLAGQNEPESGWRMRLLSLPSRERARLGSAWPSPDVFACSPA